MREFLVVAWPLLPALLLGLLAGLLLRRAAAAPEDVGHGAVEQEIAARLPSPADVERTSGWERPARGPSSP